MIEPLIEPKAVGRIVRVNVSLLDKEESLMIRGVGGNHQPEIDHYPKLRRD